MEMRTNRKEKRFLLIMGFAASLEILGIGFDWILFTYGIGMPVGNGLTMIIALPLELGGMILMAYGIIDYTGDWITTVAAVSIISVILLLELIDPIIGRIMANSLFGMIL